jgi:hypothetical protein
MFINKIDEYIDHLLDNFYYKVIKENQSKSKITSEIDNIKDKNDFYKYQKNINNMTKDYITNNVNNNDIKKIIVNDDNIPKIISIIEKYITYYILLFIGFYQKDSNDYINSLIQLSKTLKNIDTESISLLSKYFSFIKLVYEVVNLEKLEQVAKLVNKSDKYKEVIIFLNELGNDYIKKYLTGTDLTNIHNIIKVVIFKLIYINRERVDILKLLVEEDKREYKYIEIVIPKAKYLDYFVVENMFSNRQIRFRLRI